MRYPALHGNSDDYAYDATGQVRWGRRAAGLLIRRDDTGAIFLALRSEDVMDPGLWGIPGGRVEPGQTDQEAAFEETLEELGTLPPVEVVGEHIMQSGSFTYTTYVAVMAGADAATWRPQLNWENDAWRWFQRLPHDTHPGVRATVRALRRRRRR
jgi:8-oxo-dGTP pyrophosphatase MutT (NUDIX family)